MTWNKVANIGTVEFARKIKCRNFHIAWDNNTMPYFSWNVIVIKNREHVQWLSSHGEANNKLVPIFWRRVCGRDQNNQFATNTIVHLKSNIACCFIMHFIKTVRDFCRFSFSEHRATKVSKQSWFYFVGIAVIHHYEKVVYVSIARLGLLCLGVCKNFKRYLNLAEREGFLSETFLRKPSQKESQFAGLVSLLWITRRSRRFVSLLLGSSPILVGARGNKLKWVWSLFGKIKAIGRMCFQHALMINNTSLFYLFVFKKTIFIRTFFSVLNVED